MALLQIAGIKGPIYKTVLISHQEKQTVLRTELDA